METNDQLMRSEVRRIEQMIIGLREYTDARVEEIRRATALAQASNDERLRGMNEFRSAMKDQESLFARRDEIARMEVDIRDLRESRAQLAGKASAVSVYGAFALAIAGLVFSIINFLNG